MSPEHTTLRYPFPQIWVTRIITVLLVIVSLSAGYYLTKYQNAMATLREVRKTCPLEGSR